MRKLLVPMVMAAFAVVPAALAATGPMRPVLPDNGPGADEAEPRERAALSREAGVKRSEARRQARRGARPAVTIPPQLEAIAQCESGGDPRAIGGGGAYRGKYQFSYATWAAVGGSGDPAQASEAEQDRRAALLYTRSGPGQWPACGS